MGPRNHVLDGKRTEPWPYVTRTENCVKLRHAVFQICERTDIQTDLQIDRQTDMHTDIDIHIYRHAHGNSYK